MNVETVTVRMSRSDERTPWGFRLQGGSEFDSPLLIGAVAPGSLSDRAGLLTDDTVMDLSGREAIRMRHTQAQDLILASGNHLDLVVQRSASGGTSHIWKPSITVKTGQDGRDSQTIGTGQQNVGTGQQNVGTGQQNGGTGGTRFTPLHPPSTAPPPPPKPYSPGSGTGTGPPSVKVSLEHQYAQTGGRVPGFNVSPKPFGSSHLQYNSPLNVYSSSKVADQYLKQTAAAKTDQNGTAKSSSTIITEKSISGGVDEAPAYLKSPTFRLLKESEHNVETINLSQREQERQIENNGDMFRGKNPQFQSLTMGTEGIESKYQTETKLEGMPICGVCGRSILGVFCKTENKSVHAGCFNCSTCGSPLKNVGHVVHNKKLYCQLHGNQLKHPKFGPAPPIPPGAFLPRAPAPQQARSNEPVKAFYQPEILAKGPVRVGGGGTASQPSGTGTGPPAAHMITGTWKSPGPISAGNRGVPRAAPMYGADLQGVRNITYGTGGQTSATSGVPKPLAPSQNLQNLAYSCDSLTGKKGETLPTRGVATESENKKKWQQNGSIVDSTEKMSIGEKNGVGHEGDRQARPQEPLRGRGVLTETETSSTCRIPVCN